MKKKWALRYFKKQQRLYVGKDSASSLPRLTSKVSDAMTFDTERDALSAASALPALCICKPEPLAAVRAANQVRLDATSSRVSSPD